VTGPDWLQRDLERIEDLLLRSAGESTNGLVSDASTHLIKAGGKRVRPALVLVTARAGNGPRRATDLSAAAVELVHLATLYHDDVLDESDTRRGVPTVHTKWGLEIAVLAGDYLFARGCWLGAQAGGDVPEILARAIAHVCEGQIAETATIGDTSRTVDDYLDTIRRKTAALFRAACELGAATSGAPGDVRDALVAFGEQLGMAFQIVDDVLDLVGDPEATGKVPGTDLKEGVFTLPVLLGCEADPPLRDRISAGERDIATILPRLEAVGAVAAALEVASTHADAAYGVLRGLPGEEWCAVLESLIDTVIAQVPRAA
jgi:heptaprenyl diphosphate synthase